MPSRAVCSEQHPWARIVRDARDPCVPHALGTSVLHVSRFHVFTCRMWVNVSRPPSPSIDPLRSLRSCVFIDFSRFDFTFSRFCSIFSFPAHRPWRMSKFGSWGNISSQPAESWCVGECARKYQPLAVCVCVYECEQKFFACTGARRMQCQCRFRASPVCMSACARLQASPTTASMQVYTRTYVEE